MSGRGPHLQMLSQTLAQNASGSKTSMGGWRVIILEAYVGNREKNMRQKTKNTMTWGNLVSLQSAPENDKVDLGRRD